jgi:hypothetical protein
MSDDPAVVHNATDSNNELNVIISMATVATDSTTAPVQLGSTIVPPKHVPTTTKRLTRMKPESKTVFLDDPTQTVPVIIDPTDIASLATGNYLYTRLIDYLIQRSITMKDHDNTVIASSLSLPLMQTLLQKEQEDTKLNVVCKGQKHLRTTYQYYSTKEFRFFSLLCADKFFCDFFNIQCKSTRW